MASPPPLHEFCWPGLKSAGHAPPWAALAYDVPADAASTSWAMAQMKAANSRAMAMAATVDFLPLRVRERKRLHNRTCAFQAISRAGRSAAATEACFSKPTRAG